MTHYGFYEKVTNVKADVAAVLVSLQNRPECVSFFVPSPGRYSFRSLERQSLPRLYWRHPRRRASIRTLNGPLRARCNLGSDLRSDPSPL